MTNRYIKCEKCLANYHESKEHRCDPLLKMLVNKARADKKNEKSIRKLK